MSIVITGNPGVGKHRLAEKISNLLRLSILDINQIAKDEGLFEKNGESNDVDTEKLAVILKEKISDSCLIVGHLAPYVLDKNQVKVAIIVRRNPYELIPVYQKRNYSYRKIKENAGSEILGIIAHDAINKFQESAIQINNSKKSMDDVCTEVTDIISGKSKGRQVDWLDFVVKKNDLKKFFGD